MGWPVVNGKETLYRYAAGYDPYVKKAQGVHFYKAKGYGEKAAFWLRPYHPPAESPDKEFPFWLTTGRVLEHWHSRLDDPPHQAAASGRAGGLCRDEPRRRRRDGRQEGRRVKLVSRRGSLELPVEVDGRGRPPRGTVFVPFFDEGKLINLVTLDAMDNISKQPDYKKCAIVSSGNALSPAADCSRLCLRRAHRRKPGAASRNRGRAIDRAARGRACLRRRTAGDSARDRRCVHDLPR